MSSSTTATRPQSYSETYQAFAKEAQEQKTLCHESIERLVLNAIALDGFASTPQLTKDSLKTHATQYRTARDLRNHKLPDLLKQLQAHMAERQRGAAIPVSPAQALEFAKVDPTLWTKLQDAMKREHVDNYGELEKLVQELIVKQKELIEAMTKTKAAWENVATKLGVQGTAYNTVRSFVPGADHYPRAQALLNELLGEADLPAVGVAPAGGASSASAAAAAAGAPPSPTVASALKPMPAAAAAGSSDVLDFNRFNESPKTLLPATPPTGLLATLTSFLTLGRTAAPAAAPAPQSALDAAAGVPSQLAGGSPLPPTATAGVQAAASARAQTPTQAASVPAQAEASGAAAAAGTPAPRDEQKGGQGPKPQSPPKSSAPVSPTAAALTAATGVSAASQGKASRRKAGS